MSVTSNIDGEFSTLTVQAHDGVLIIANNEQERADSITLMRSAWSVPAGAIIAKPSQPLPS